MACVMEYMKLRTGAMLPLLGLGTWPTKEPEELKLALRTALDSGYRLIDTAGVYGNEAIIGEVLAEYFSEKKLKRKEVFITTKLPFYVYTTEDIEKCFEKQLQDLRLDYVDLYLLHCPCVAENVFNEETGRFEPKTKDDPLKYIFIEYTHVDIWKTLEKLYMERKIRALGVSNFSYEQLAYMMERCAIPPHNLQVEAHLYWPQEELLKYCEANEVTFTAFAPLGCPGRKNSEDAIIPPSYELMKNETVVYLADKYNKSPAQILLRFLTQREMCAIPRSTNPDHIKENINIFGFQLSQQDMFRLYRIPTRERFYLFEWFFESDYYPFTDVTRREAEEKMVLREMAL